MFLERKGDLRAARWDGQLDCRRPDGTGVWLPVWLARAPLFSSETRDSKLPCLSALQSCLPAAGAPRIRFLSPTNRGRDWESAFFFAMKKPHKKWMGGVCTFIGLIRKTHRHFRGRDGVCTFNCQKTWLKQPGRGMLGRERTHIIFTLTWSWNGFPGSLTESERVQ